MTKYSIVKKHVDEMDLYSLLLNGATDDEFDSESWEISYSSATKSYLHGRGML